MVSIELEFGLQSPTLNPYKSSLLKIKKNRELTYLKKQTKPN